VRRFPDGRSPPAWLMPCRQPIGGPSPSTSRSLAPWTGSLAARELRLPALRTSDREGFSRFVPPAYRYPACVGPVIPRADGPPDVDGPVGSQAKRGPAVQRDREPAPGEDGLRVADQPLTSKARKLACPFDAGRR